MPEIEDRALFIHPQRGTTLARAVRAHLEALREVGRNPAELCVASAHFNPQGLALPARKLRHVPRIRLLLGADPTPNALLPRRRTHPGTELRGGDPELALKPIAGL